MASRVARILKKGTKNRKPKHSKVKIVTADYRPGRDDIIYKIPPWATRPGVIASNRTPWVHKDIPQTPVVPILGGVPKQPGGGKKAPKIKITLKKWKS